MESHYYEFDLIQVNLFFKYEAIPAPEDVFAVDCFLIGLHGDVDVEGGENFLAALNSAAKIKFQNHAEVEKVEFSFGGKLVNGLVFTFKKNEEDKPWHIEIRGGFKVTDLYVFGRDTARWVGEIVSIARPNLVVTIGKYARIKWSYLNGVLQKEWADSGYEPQPVDW